ncbi:MAG: DUF1926 domain-containing protein [Candidatus Krumholzibacteriota bacterium]|nr:DUF1926 domain-containing protein [Candidatus Krumholzibacteriota bacterium]
MPTLILGVHNHQPVGNFDHVVREAYDRAYRPFLELLDAHPAMRLCVHVSGPLIEWMKREAPDYLERLRAGATAGRLELLGGGYWEPILTVLTERDQHAQLERMSREVEALCGRRPRGIWLAERIWEPHLPRVLQAHGIEYAALDDTHFLATGFTPDRLGGYFLTEEGGRALALFPISKRLRYLVPFRAPAEVLAYLRGSAAPGDGDLAGADAADAEGVPGLPLAVLMDDGEKFGVWPGTNDLCYTQGRLAKLFGALAAEPGLRLATFSEVLDEQPPLGPAYLPTGSYFEMGEWALPLAGQQKLAALTALVKQHDGGLQPFVRGGFWRNFFAKYEESHWLHKRMLWAGRAVSAAREAGTADAGALAEAEDRILEAQCNCGYWHGLFGGLYLPHLRHAILERLVRAEHLVAGPGYTLAQEDLDIDGDAEIVWTSPAARLFLKPRGGRVRELDLREPAFPLTNVLARREEFYHRRLAEALAPGEAADAAKSIHDIVRAKETGLEEFLVYDPHPRASLEERLYETGADAAPYAGSWQDLADLHCAVELPAAPDGELVLRGERAFETGRRLELVKRLRWADDGWTLAVDLALCYHGPGRLASLLASGWNLNLLAPEAPDRRVLVDGRPAADARLRSRGWERDIGRLELRDDWSGLAVALAGEELDVWREPIETVSLSEAGFERVYQGSWLAVARRIELESGQTARLRYRLELARLAGATA